MTRAIIFVELDVARFDQELAAVRHGVAGVETEIHEHLLDLRGVGAHGEKVFGEGELDLDFFADGFFEQRRIFADELVEIEIRGSENLAPRIGEELPREPRGSLGLRADFFEVFLAAARRGRISRAEFGPAHDCADYIIEIVRNAAGEFADDFEFFQLAHALFDAAPFAAIFGFAKLAVHSGNQTGEIVFYDVVLRADAHGVHGHVFADRAGDENKRNVQAAFAENRERFGAGKARHGVIGNNYVPCAGIER